MTKLGMLLFALLAAATARTLTVQERIKEFREAAMAERSKRGLTRPQLAQKYPTPELTLVPAAVPLVVPGETVKVKAKGKIAKGSLVVLDCDDVQTSALKQTANGVDAQVKIPPFVPSKACNLVVMAPVSAWYASLTALRIGAARYSWKLKLANGLSAEITMSDRPGMLPELVSTWRDGDKTLGERSAQIQVARPKVGESLQISVQRSPDDARALDAQWEADPAHAELAKVEQERAPLNAEKHRLLKQNRDACIAEAGGPVRLNEKVMFACEKRRGEEVAQQFRVREQPFVDREFPFRKRESEIRANHPTACDALDLVIDEGGKVTGKAHGCKGSGDVDVTGTLTAARP
jgi:hypothetical protein